MEITRLLKNNRGEVALHLSIILLIGTLLLSAALEVYHVYAVIRQVELKTNEAVLAVASANVPEVWGGTRESSGNARHYTDTGWISNITTSDVITNLNHSLGVTSDGGTTLTKYASMTRISYRLLNIQTRYVNTTGSNLNFLTTATIEIPLSLGVGVLPPIRFPMEVQTAYDAKF